MIVRLLFLATLAGCSTVPETPGVIYYEIDEDALPSLEECAVVFHGLVLDRETLQPVANVTVTRVDGNVTVQGNGGGEFAFPMDLGQFGACMGTKDGGVACTRDDPETTRFVVSGADMSPVVVGPDKYSGWTGLHPLLVWRKASLHGRWLDAVGEPVARRELVLESESIRRFDLEQDFPPLKVTTDDQGEFEVDTMPANVKWTLRPANEEDGLVRIDVSTLVLAPGESRELHLRTSPTVRVTGVVRGVDGKVLEGASVRLVRDDRRVRTETAADGSFVFDRVGTGPVDLIAIYPDGYNDTEQGTTLGFDAKVTSALTDLDVRLKPFREISGRVLDAAHHPVARGQICYEPAATPASGRDASQDCDTDGVFRLHGLISDRVRMIATDEECGAHSAVSSAESGANGIEMVLEPTGRITGRVSGAVLGEYEDLLVGADFVSDTPGDPILRTGWTLQVTEVEPGQETFVLEGVPAGSWRVDASVMGKQMSVGYVVDVQAGRTAVCPDLALKPMAEVELVAAPNCGDLDVDIRFGPDSVVHTKLARGTVRVVQVPAGTMTIVAKDTQRTVSEKTLDVAPASVEIVGLGFER